jgi:LmbE family N-acetylglucosaminyl deacetylase
VCVEERQFGAADRGVIKLILPKKDWDPVTLLCLGAHADDIEIGCGGTLLYLKSTLSRLSFYWVVFSASGLRGQEAAKAADLFTAGSDKQVVLKDYQDGFMPYKGGAVKDFFEQMKGQVNPDLIFTHWHGDAHQDHRLVCELTWNTFRNHLILEYEIPKYDGDLGRPNLFVPLESDVYQKKVGYIMDAFQSQHAKPWFGESTFLSLMRLRGMECNAPSSHAEAFHCRKLVL